MEKRIEHDKDTDSKALAEWLFDSINLKVTAAP